MTEGIVIAALALGAYLLNRKAEKLSTIEFTPTGARVHKLTLTYIELYLNLGYVNPSNVSQTVDGLFFKVLKGDANLGTINRKTPFTIQPKSENSLEVPVKLNLLSSAAGILKSLTGEKMNVLLDGYATVAGQEIRIKKTVPVDLGGYLSNILSLFKRK